MLMTLTATGCDVKISTATTAEDSRGQQVRAIYSPYSIPLFILTLSIQSYTTKTKSNNTA